MVLMYLHENVKWSLRLMRHDNTKGQEEELGMGRLASTWLEEQERVDHIYMYPCKMTWYGHKPHNHIESMTGHVCNVGPKRMS